MTKAMPVTLHLLACGMSCSCLLCLHFACHRTAAATAIAGDDGYRWLGCLCQPGSTYEAAAAISFAHNPPVTGQLQRMLQPVMITSAG